MYLKLLLFKALSNFAFTQIILLRVLFSALLLAGYQLVFSQIPKRKRYTLGFINFNSNMLIPESGKNYNGILGGSPSLTTDRFGNSNYCLLVGWC